MLFPHVKGTEKAIESLRRYSRAIGRSLMEEVVRAARIVAVSCARSTQPYGLEDSSRFSGEAAVNRDIRKVFAAPDTVFAEIRAKNDAASKQFWNAYKEKDFLRMRKVLDSVGDSRPMAYGPMRKLHQQARTGRRAGVTLKIPKQIVINPQSIGDYIGERQKFVGFAKAGWARAAERLGGTRGIPAWARRNLGAPGGATLSGSDLKPLVVIYNRVRYVEDTLPPKEVELAVRIGYERLLKQMAIIAKKRHRAA